jgi:hypothetical protein
LWEIVITTLNFQCLSQVASSKLQLTLVQP